MNFDLNYRVSREFRLGELSLAINYIIKFTISTGIL